MTELVAIAARECHSYVWNFSVDWLYLILAHIRREGEGEGRERRESMVMSRNRSPPLSLLKNKIEDEGKWENEIDLLI